MTEQPRRLTQGEVIRMLLERGSVEHSNVTLTRNAKGDVQIEVNVRTSDGTEIDTPDKAEAVAVAVFDRLADRYPYAGALASPPAPKGHGGDGAT